MDGLVFGEQVNGMHIITYSPSATITLPLFNHVASEYYLANAKAPLLH
jgi:hypothetical protein